MRWSRRSRRLLAAVALSVITFSLSLTLGWASPANATSARHYTDLEFPPLGEIKIPDFERFELDNGLVVYLMEDHDLPLVRGSATFRTGSFLDPAGKVGLGSITGEAMRLGGTLSHPADQLNALLEQKAAAVETSLDTTSGSASFDTLSEDLEVVFDLFAEVISEPAFANDKIELIKSQYRGSIARRNDDPDEVTTREFRKLVYGASSPYARTTEYADLDNITRVDVVEFYQSTIRPQDTILGISGDFDPTQMKRLIEQYFGSWQGVTSSASVVKANSSVLHATQQQYGLFVVDQPQLTQSYIHIGHLGGRLDNPFHAPLSILNEVLNGFGGRLFNDIRSRQGLAYVVYAYWSPRYDYPGLFIGGGQTRSEATVPFIQSMMQEIERVRTEVISDQELQYAKDAVLNSFVFNFATPDQTLSRLIRYEYYGYPSDFVFQFQQGVENTTAEQVKMAAQENLKPEDLVTVVVGNLAEINPPLQELGENVTVTKVDISIPEPKV
jgi:zinc protease